MANFVEKENIFLRIAKYLFPWKGDKPAASAFSSAPLLY